MENKIINEIRNAVITLALLMTLLSFIFAIALSISFQEIHKQNNQIIELIQTDKGE